MTQVKQRIIISTHSGNVMIVANEKRQDCVRLKTTFETSDVAYRHVQVVAIAYCETIGTVCVGSPLYDVNAKNEIPSLDPFQSLVVDYFPVVRSDRSTLVSFSESVLLRHEQIQFICALNCNYGLVNVFCYSNIIRSTQSQTTIALDAFLENSHTASEEGSSHTDNAN